MNVPNLLALSLVLDRCHLNKLVPIILEFAHRDSNYGKRLWEIKQYTYPRDLCIYVCLPVRTRLGLSSKLNLDFDCPPGELSFYMHIRSTYIGRYAVSGNFSGGLELNESSKPMNVDRP